MNKAVDYLCQAFLFVLFFLSGIFVSISALFFSGKKEKDAGRKLPIFHE